MLTKIIDWGLYVFALIGWTLTFALLLLGLVVLTLWALDLHPVVQPT